MFWRWTWGRRDFQWVIEIVHMSWAARLRNKEIRIRLSVGVNCRARRLCLMLISTLLWRKIGWPVFKRPIDIREMIKPRFFTAIELLHIRGGIFLFLNIRCAIWIRLIEPSTSNLLHYLRALHENRNYNLLRITYCNYTKPKSRRIVKETKSSIQRVRKMAFNHWQLTNICEMI